MTVSPEFGGGVFPFGTHIYREPCFDLEGVLADLPLLKKLGFNMVKIQEHWAADERREGEYDFSNVERLIARAGELDLGIYLGLTMEQAPAWLWRKYPDCHMVYANGQPHNQPTQYMIPADGKPGPCWDHPGAREAAAKFIGELARTLGRYDNIWAWNTFQEIGFWPNTAGKLGFCYCGHTLDRFREWLQEKYGSLDALNAAWMLHYGDWQEVEPPRREHPVTPFIDWRYFMDDVYMVRNLSFKTQALRENDPQGRPVFSHSDTPRVASGAEWRWARTADFWGTSNYPHWHGRHDWDDPVTTRHEGLHYEMWQEMFLGTDNARCATGRDRAVWGAEFQGGPVSTSLHFGTMPTPEDLRLWMLGGLASGMTAISFWNHRVERFWKEANGFGLLDPTGDTTERMETASFIGRKIQEQGRFFAHSQPPRAQVALLVNEDLYHFFQGSDHNVIEHYQYNMRGWYLRLWRMGIPIDFLDAEEVAAGDLAHYKAAILTMPLALDPDYFAHLQRYVEQGGTLISEACPGRFDRYGWCTVPQMVAGGEALFGLRHESLHMVKEPGGESRWMFAERQWGEFLPSTILQGTGAADGAAVLANFYIQTLALDEAEALLTAGDSVVAALNRVGSGTAILIGTFLGMSALAHKEDDPGSDAFIEQLLSNAGVQPDRCGKLLRRRRVLDQTEAWFFANPTPDEISEHVSLDGWAFKADLLGDALLEQTAESISIRVPANSLCCILVEDVEA